MRKIPKEISQLLPQACPLGFRFPTPDRSEKNLSAWYSIYFKILKKPVVLQGLIRLSWLPYLPGNNIRSGFPKLHTQQYKTGTCTGGKTRSEIPAIFWLEDDLFITWFGFELFQQSSKDWTNLSYPQNDEVEKSVNTGALKFGLSRILHQLCVLACKNHHPIAPISVPEYCSS